MAKNTLSAPSNLKSKTSNPQSLRVLIVEDSEDDVLLIIRELKKGGYDPVYERVETAAAMKKGLREKQWDVILCDYKLPKFSGIKAIALLKETNIDIPIIIVSGTIGEETAVECMRLGAHDYIMKNNFSRLCPAIARGLEEADSRSKRKQAESQREAALEALRRSEEKHRTIFENIAEGYYEEDLAGNFTFFNNSMCLIYGYSREELMDMNYRQYTDKETAKKLFQVFNGIYKTGSTSQGYSFELIRKDGIKKYIEASASIKKDSLDRPIGFRGIIRDVTSRREAEEALGKSEEKYRTLLDNASDAILLANDEGNLLEVNKKAQELLGYTKEELLGVNIARIHPPEELEKIINTFKEINRDGLGTVNNTAVLRKDGKTVFVDISGSVIEYSGKKVLQGIFREITERKQMEDALRKSEEKYRTILEEMDEGYFEIDLAGNFTFVNDAECRNMGYSHKELIGMNNRQYTDKENAKKVYHAFTNIYKTGETGKIFDYEIIKKDGTKAVSELLVSLVKDSKGKPIGFRGVSRHITERKRAEEALRVSEEKYRLVVENAKEGIIIAQDLNLVFVNRAALDLLEYSGELLVKPFTDFIHPDDRNMVVDYHIRRLKGEEVPLAYSFRVITRDGTVKWVEFNTAVIQWKERPATLSFLNDITARKQAEDALRESEERYRTIIETMQDGYWETDLAGSFTFVNEAQCRLSGTLREQLLGKNNRAYTSEEEAKKLYQLFSGIYRTGEPVSGFAFEFIKRDGAKAFHEVSASLMRDSKGKPIGFRGISRNVTERKQAEETLRRSEEKYRNILENMEEGYFELDLAGNFTFVNDAECNNLGYPREELIGMNNRQYQNETAAKEMYQLFSKIYRTGELVTASDVEIIRKNGTKGFNEISVSLIRDAEGKPIGFQGISRDITERKQAEEERKQSFERMRKALGATVQAISLTVEMKDPYTSGHQRRVSDLARSIATEMGLSADQRDFVRTASAIHDIGKISIPSEILSKPTKLTDLEFSLIKTHPQSGYDILKDVEFPWPVADVVLQHHERMNGSGYPQGLKGDDIILEARILAIADVVEAIASHRPYRPALGIELALEEIEKNKGILYDNTVTDACLRLFREKSYQFP